MISLRDTEDECADLLICVVVCTVTTMRNGGSRAALAPVGVQYPRIRRDGGKENRRCRCNDC
jgi:hypothetical protein